MVKLETAILGVMAFLILGVLGLIAYSPDAVPSTLSDDVSKEHMVDKVEMMEDEMTMDDKMTIGDEMTMDDKMMMEDEMTMDDEMMMDDDNNTDKPSVAPIVSIPSDSGIPGCESTNACYIPYSLTVDVMTTVTWTNDDVAAHTVTSGTAASGPDDIFDSSLFTSGSEFEYTFEDKGEYQYFCILHPWMSGSVTVN